MLSTNCDLCMGLWVLQLHHKLPMFIAEKEKRFRQWSLSAVPPLTDLFILRAHQWYGCNIDMKLATVDEGRMTDMKQGKMLHKK